MGIVLFFLGGGGGFGGDKSTSMGIVLYITL